MPDKYLSWKVGTGDIVEIRLADGSKIIVKFGDASRKKRKATFCVPPKTKITLKTKGKE